MFFNRDWMWEAETAEGEVLRKRDGLTCADFVDKNVVRFHAVRGRRRVSFDVPEGAAPVFLYLNYVWSALTPQERRVRLAVIGWEREEEKAYAILLPGGLAIITDDYNAIRFENAGGDISAVLLSLRHSAE